MIKRFIFELCLGIVVLVAIILLGIVGSAAFALMVFLIPFCKKKPDEREMQLFYKVGNITAGASIGLCVLIFQCSNYFVNGHRVGDLWLFWVIASFFIAHGIIGIIVYKKQ